MNSYYLLGKFGTLVYDYSEKRYSIFLFYVDVDTEKDILTLPIKYGGFLLFNNLTPHRR